VLKYIPIQLDGAQDFDTRMETIATPLRALDESAVRRRFQLPEGDVLLKTTLSLCPACLAHVPAAVTRRGAAVWITKLCAEHGMSEGVLENDARWYRLSSKDRWGRAYHEEKRQDIPAFAGSCCGPGESCGPTDKPAEKPRDFADQSGNKTCTVLVEITDACNLACRVCYSDSKGDRILPPEDFKRSLTEMIAAKGRLDSVQITGGEASLHPAFWDMPGGP